MGSPNQISSTSSASVYALQVLADEPLLRDVGGVGVRPEFERQPDVAQFAGVHLLAAVATVAVALSTQQHQQQQYQHQQQQ